MNRTQFLYLFLLLTGFHFLEHIIQMLQVYLFNISRSQAMGILGGLYPWLMRTEILHFTYALLMYIGIFTLLFRSKGRARRWWKLTLTLQTWHLFEHCLLFAQAVFSIYFFGRTEATSLIQLVLPKIEGHFFYNLVVFVPLMIASYFEFHTKDKDILVL